MPEAAGEHPPIYLDNVQGMYFGTRKKTRKTILDKRGRKWALEAGLSDAGQRHFGIFDANVLMGRIALTAPHEQHEHPSTFWCSGAVEIVESLQRQTIGPQFIEALVARSGKPIASDIDQSDLGRKLWEALIERNPGKVVLYGPSGPMGVVTGSPGNYTPAPWQFRDRRLVLNP